MAVPAKDVSALVSCEDNDENVLEIGIDVDVMAKLPESGALVAVTYPNVESPSGLYVHTPLPLYPMKQGSIQVVGLLGTKLNGDVAAPTI